MGPGAGRGGHHLGPAAEPLADFGTISAYSEQSLTLPETAPPGMGMVPQQVLTTAGEGTEGQD